jgi:hypothetical protein
MYDGHFQEGSVDAVAYAFLFLGLRFFPHFFFLLGGLHSFFL